jgi:APA family basic amino acid/polyamine antiporter
LQAKLKTLKRIFRSLFLGTLIVTIVYFLANVAYQRCYLCTEILWEMLSTGIMFASNDRVGTAAAGMIMGI